MSPSKKREEEGGMLIEMNDSSESLVFSFESATVRDKWLEHIRDCWEQNVGKKGVKEGFKKISVEQEATATLPKELKKQIESKFVKGKYIRSEKDRGKKGNKTPEERNLHDTEFKEKMKIFEKDLSLRLDKIKPNDFTAPKSAREFSSAPSENPPRGFSFSEKNCWELSHQKKEKEKEKEKEDNSKKRNHRKSLFMPKTSQVTLHEKEEFEEYEEEERKSPTRPPVVNVAILPGKKHSRNKSQSHAPSGELSERSRVRSHTLADSKLYLVADQLSNFNHSPRSNFPMPKVFLSKKEDSSSPVRESLSPSTKDNSFAESDFAASAPLKFEEHFLTGPKTVTESTLLPLSGVFGFAENTQENCREICGIKSKEKEQNLKQVEDITHRKPRVHRVRKGHGSITSVNLNGKNESKEETVVESVAKVSSEPATMENSLEKVSGDSEESKEEKKDPNLLKELNLEPSNPRPRKSLDSSKAHMLKQIGDGGNVVKLENIKKKPMSTQTETFKESVNKASPESSRPEVLSMEPKKTEKAFHLQFPYNGDSPRFNVSENDLFITCNLCQEKMLLEKVDLHDCKAEVPSKRLSRAVGASIINDQRNILRKGPNVSSPLAGDKNCSSRIVIHSLGDSEDLPDKEESESN